ncbi:MAG: hypothetical protein H6718_04060 [Polyangiaceae bacterium]|nr:hypothetical protein [Polyangiaceae bacterium]
MSVQRAGLNQYASTIQILEGSDNRNAASVAVALEGLTDRTAFLRGQMDSAIAQTWHRFTYSLSDASNILPYTDGVGTEGFMVWIYGDPQWRICLDDGQQYTQTNNGIDVGTRAQRPGVAYMLAVEEVTVPHYTAGLQTEFSTDAGINWIAGDALPANLKVFHAAWANVTASGAWVLAAADATNDWPYVCLFDAAGNLISSTNLLAGSMADQDWSSVCVGGADGSIVILAEDGNYYRSAEGAGNDPVWTAHFGPWTDGVKIDWSVESGFVAVWPNTAAGSFKWSQSDDGITWSAAVTQSFAYADTSVGDELSDANARPCFAVLRGLWAIVTWDSDTPKVGIRITYSTDQGDTWWHHGVHAPSLTGPPSLAKNASGLGFCVENNYWVSLKAGDPRFGG